MLDYLPHLLHDLPPKGATYYHFAEWRDDGTDKTIHDLLRRHLREQKKRLADPSLVVLDTQSVHVAAGVPAETTGRDVAKKVPDRKRDLAVDVLGPGIQERGRRPWRQPGNRRGHRRTQPRRQRLRAPAETMGRRADLRDLDVPPAPGPRL
ncbi:hypothetical protein HNP84_009333 [Thermocatellispora tengchongensis]|uniref:Transposase n=1 Tax=Thermocatellispora tengchongensis TaxID=1073253 RepID=A0A840PPC8_9ACTN|nr:hypothetical protein [Thermocatellispora tengchongensis]MBB5139570.1 hypothetical protein [Thermocatellispora tengchongensis]